MLEKQAPLDLFIPNFFLLDENGLYHTTRDIPENSKPTIPIYQKRPPQVLRWPLYLYILFYLALMKPFIILLPSPGFSQDLMHYDPLFEQGVRF